MFFQYQAGKNLSSNYLILVSKVSVSPQELFLWLVHVCLLRVISALPEFSLTECLTFCLLVKLNYETRGHA